MGNSLLIRGIIGIFVLFSFLSMANGQDERFINFNTGNGKLMHNTVEAIARDHYGYVWIGTNFGLNRLDGYQTINFINDPENPNSLSNNFVKALLVDKAGELWVGTIGGGLNRFNRNSNGFINYQSNDTVNSISGNNIAALTEDSEGNIWMGILGKGINKFDKNSDTFTSFELEPYDPFNRENSNVNTMFSDREGNIWVGLTKSEIYKIESKTGKICYHGMPVTSKNANVGAITGIAQLQDGTMIFTTWNGKLLFLDLKTEQHVTVHKHSAYLEYAVLSDVVVDQYNNIWISTWNNGMYQIDPDTFNSKHFQHKANVSYSLSSNSINHLFIDRDQNLWVCLLDNGISLLSLKEKMFHTLDLSSDKFENINVFSITKDRSENLWMGSRGQGLWKYNLKTKKTRNYLSEDYPGLNSNSILTIKQGTDGKIYIGTDGRFLSIFDPLDQSFTQVNHIHNDWSSAVFAIAETDSFIWAGTWGGGIKKVNKNTLTYTAINFDTKDQFRNSVFALELVDSILWVANVGMGLIRFNINNEHYKVYTHSEKMPDFPRERITDIHVEHENSLWITTDGAGFFHFIPSEERIISVNDEFGPLDLIVQASITDSKQNLWVTTSSGVYYVEKESKRSFNFNDINGLLNGQLNKSAIYYDEENNMVYTGGVNGVNYCKPDQIIIDSLLNKVIVNQVFIMGKNLFYPNGEHLKKAIDVAEILNLFHRDKIVTLHFSSLEFTPSLKSRYYYQLEGFDKEWVETPYSKNFVQYTNLKPGKYNFRVKACNSDGIWSEEETNLKIIVYPAFWQTFVFKLMVFMLIIVFVFLYFHRKNRALIKAKQKLEEMVAERTSEIVKQNEQIIKQKVDLEISNNAKNKFFSMISHDLRSPLVSIDQLVKLIIMQYNTVSEERILEYFSLLQNASTNTLSLLDDLLIWARTQTNRIVINKTEVPLDELLSGMMNYAQPMAQKKGISIEFPLNSDYMVNIDVNMIHTVFRNLISNAIKFSHKNSSIEIKVSDEKEHITVAIVDKGLGMKPTLVNNLFNIEHLYSSKGTSGEEGTGLGLVLCHEFLDLNGGKIWVESEKGLGSTFYFTLPKS